MLFQLDRRGLLTVTRMLDHSRAQFDKEVKLKSIEIYGHRPASSEKPVVKDMTRYMGNVEDIEDITVPAWEGAGEAEAKWSNFKVTLDTINIQFDQLAYLRELPLLHFCFADCVPVS